MWENILWKFFELWNKIVYVLLKKNVFYIVMKVINLLIVKK